MYTRFALASVERLALPWEAVKPKWQSGQRTERLQRCQATLRAALAASIDAAIEAERYASEHGPSIRFGSEDLRAMALRESSGQ